MNNDKLVLPHRWLLILGVMFALPLAVFAHGDEDHSAEKAAVVVTGGANMVTRTANAGEWEVMLKHSSLTADRQAAGRVFVTHHDTNEPLKAANLTMLIEPVNKAMARQTINARETNIAGVFDIVLPPIPEAAYKFSIKVEARNQSEIASFGEVEIMRAPLVEAGSVNGWAQRGLMLLGALVALGGVTLFAGRLLQNARKRKAHVTA